MSKHNDIRAPEREDFLKSLSWLFLPMKGFERLSLNGDGLDADLALSYRMKTLRHHVVALALFANPPQEGVKR
jgi:hypothetical protein